MRLPTVALPAAVALALALAAAPAAAKELATLDVCGPTTCSDRTADVGRDAHRLLDGGTPDDGPAAAAPFVELRMGIGDGRGATVGRVTVRFVPRDGLLLGPDGAWTAPPPDVVALLRRLSADVDRFPAAQLPGVVAPPARVVETVAPQPAARDDGGRRTWWAATGIAALVGAGAAAAVGVRRRRRHGPHGEAAATG